MNSQWIWIKSPIPPKCKLDKWQKDALVAKAEEFVRAFYLPTFVKPPPPKPKFNYVVDFSVRWHGSYLRFTAKYACTFPDAVSPFFEHNFARLGYFGPDRFNLWARRHNEEWIVLGDELTLQDCFDEMRTNPWFHF